ncbi:MAG: nuclear transport factor 2 family protein [Polyangiaceae bacterium]
MSQIEQAILRSVYSLFRAVDDKQWAASEALLAPELLVDYGTAEHTSNAAVVTLWRTLLSPLDATQHLLGSVQSEVSADGEAHVTAEFVATHLKRGATGGDLFTLGGHYDITLREQGGAWRITKLKMSPRWSSGNPELVLPQ